jgi:hypothetical protein
MNKLRNGQKRRKPKEHLLYIQESVETLVIRISLSCTLFLLPITGTTVLQIQPHTKECIHTKVGSEVVVAMVRNLGPALTKPKKGHSVQGVLFSSFQYKITMLINVNLSPQPQRR